MDTDVKKLDQICSDLAGIEIDLMNGEIEFAYDNLMCAMKPGHPCEIMDGILSKIYYPAIQGHEPPMETMEETLKELKGFANAFKIKEMKKPLQELSDYITARKS